MVSGRKPNLERRRRVLELRDQGLSLSEIGRQLGTSRQTVHAIIKGVEKARQRTVLCCECRTPLDPAGVLPADLDNALCLVCMAKKRPGVTFGQKLKAFRLTVGMTRRDLDRLAGLPPSSVLHYEQDRHYPTLENRAKLAEALGVTVEVLGDGVPVPGKRGRGRPRKVRPENGKPKAGG